MTEASPEPQPDSEMGRTTPAIVREYYAFRASADWRKLDFFSQHHIDAAYVHYHNHTKAIRLALDGMLLPWVMKGVSDSEYIESCCVAFSNAHDEAKTEQKLALSGLDSALRHARYTLKRQAEAGAA